MMHLYADLCTVMAVFFLSFFARLSRNGSQGELVVYPSSRRPSTIFKDLRLCVKAVTEPDSAESTEITDRALAESTEYNGKLRFTDTGI